MKCFISIGNCSKYNIYILVSFVLEFLMDLPFGYNHSNKERAIQIIPFKAKLRSHNLLENFVRISAIFFGGILLYFIERKNEKEKSGNNNKEISILDVEEMEKDLLHKEKKSITLNLIIIGILFPLYIILKDFISLTSTSIGLWTFEIMYICVISRFILKTRIYKHIKLAIFIMFVISILVITGYCLDNTKHDDKDKDGDGNQIIDQNVFEKIITKFGAFAIPLIFIASEIRHIQRDYCWIKSKYLMDIRSFPPSKIFITIGGFGFVFIVIFFSIFSYVPCKTFHNVILVNNTNNAYINTETNQKLNLNLEYCQLKDHDNNTQTLYLFYDSIKLIARDYSFSNKDNIYEIFIVIPLYFAAYIVNEISRLMMVRYTDPNNILIYKNLYYLVKRFIIAIRNNWDEKYLTKIQFTLNEIADITYIICNLIYIEILELKFCNFDYQLKKNISKRAEKDDKLNFYIKGRESLEQEDIDSINSNDNTSLN